MDQLAAGGLGLEGLLEAAAHQLGADVGVADVGHPRRAPEGHRRLRRRHRRVFGRSLLLLAPPPPREGMVWWRTGDGVGRGVCAWAWRMVLPGGLCYARRKTDLVVGLVLRPVMRDPTTKQTKGKQAPHARTAHTARVLVSQTAKPTALSTRLRRPLNEDSFVFGFKG